VESQARMIWRRLLRRRGAAAGLLFLAALAVVSCLAPLIANNKPIAIEYGRRLSFPAFRDLYPFRAFLARDTVARRLQADPDWLAGRRFEAGGPIGFLLMPPVPYSPFQTRLGEANLPPSASRRHFFGCDAEGRDVLARMVHGAKVSLLVGVLSVGVATAVGLLLGGAAGLLGGWFDGLVVSRLIEVMLCFPTFFLILTVAAVTSPRYLNVWTIMLVIGLASWPVPARFARGEFMRFKEADFVAAARALGIKPWALGRRHLLPNALTPLAVNAAFGMAGAVLVESALSFLGVGVQPPNPSWGGVMSGAMRFWGDWWLGVFPGAAIFLTVLSYNLLGEGLSDALDPRGRVAVSGRRPWRRTTGDG
jgi:peptide/nickel transport system permease protein